VRYGGHTSCVAVARDGAARPTLILDAGTGVRRVTALLAEEVAAEAAFGHAAAEYVVALAERAGARQAVLFHHRPDRTDDALDQPRRRFAAAPIPVTVAAEELALDLLRHVRPLAGLGVTNALHHQFEQRPRRFRMLHGKGPEDPRGEQQAAQIRLGRDRRRAI
jgi:hypothetical protein